MKKYIGYIVGVAAVGAAFFIGRNSVSPDVVEHIPEGYISIDQAIPLDDICVAYKTLDDYWVFEIKDTTYVLENTANRTYEDIANEVNSFWKSVTWDESGIIIELNDGTSFLCER